MFANRFDHEANRFDHEANRLDHEANRLDHEANRFNHEANRLDHEANRLDHEANRLDHEVNRLDHEAPTLVNRSGLSNLVQVENWTSASHLYIIYHEERTWRTGYLLRTYILYTMQTSRGELDICFALIYYIP